MLSTALQLQMAHSMGDTPLTFITGLKYNTNLVKMLNNITFLYDPNWEYAPGNPSYPIAFFYVKQMEEVMSSEVSQKPMLFYNSETKGTTNGASAGLMNVVADNIIIKPKTYKLSLIIPMNTTSLMNNGCYFNVSLIGSIEKFIFTGEGGGKVDNVLSTIQLASSVTLGSLKALLTALYGTELEASSVMTMLCSQKDYNKVSIESMWRNRRILKLKMWTGWKFQYLAIQDFSVVKTGENGDYFEGTLTCTEVPILTYRAKEANTSISKLSAINKVLGAKMKAVTDGFISLMEESK